MQLVVFCLVECVYLSAEGDVLAAADGGIPADLVPCILVWFSTVLAFCFGFNLPSRKSRSCCTTFRACTLLKMSQI